ncbi:MAG: hypothetical protein JNM21_14970 [Taibaiella sp.]|nr:hypothetical protein [Taibaiella sp.]
MNESLKITPELLTYLQAAGYCCLLRRFGETVFEPRKDNIDELIEQINTAPMREDELIEISDALSQFDELELDGRELANIFEVE